MKFRIIETEQLLLEEITEKNLENLYDIEYRYHKMKSSKFNGVLQRYDNILKNVEKHAHRISDHIILEILEVFEEWYEMHDFSNPERWGESRADYLMKSSDGDIESILNSIENVYASYNPSTFREKKMLFEYFTYIEQNDIKHYALAEILRISMEEYIDNMEVEAEEDPESKETYDEYSKAFDKRDYSSMYDFFTELESIESGIDNGYIDIRDFVAEIETFLILPLWKLRWGSMYGTIDTIKDNINDLKNSETISDKFKNINIALNAVHSNGPMLEYIEETSPEVTEGLLDYLSEDFSTKKIDEELKEIGFEI